MDFANFFRKFGQLLNKRKPGGGKKHLLTFSTSTTHLYRPQDYGLEFPRGRFCFRAPLSGEPLSSRVEMMV